MSLDSVCVKEEVEIELDLKKAYEIYPYTEHEIKSEVDIGPELLQAPSISVLPDVQEENTHVTDKKEYDLKLHSSCSVRHEINEIEHAPISSKKLEQRSPVRPKTCEYCQRQFSTNYLVKNHQKLHIKQLLYSNDDNMAAKFGYMVKIESDIPSTCDVDTRESDLIKHMQTHEPVSSTLTEQSEKNVRKQYPERDDFNFAKADAKCTPYFCVTCAKVFVLTFDLFAKHLLNHIDENPLLKQTLKEFVSSDPIERSCLGKNSIFTCNTCNFSCYKEQAFRKHKMCMYVNNCCKSANETNNSSLVIPAKTLVKKRPKLTNQRPSILATALTSNKTQQEIYKETMATNSESNNESIDFQKSSLFSRLKLLNKVVGK